MAGGNGIAAFALARLGWLLGETRYLDAGEAAVRGGFPSLARAPQAHAAMLIALDEYLDSVEIVIVRGPAAEAAEWSVKLAERHSPRRMVLAIPSEVSGLPQALESKPPRERTVAYVCRGPSCSEPLTDLASLRD